MAKKKETMTDNQPASRETRPQDAVMVIPEDPEQSVYRFISVAAKRARQLQSGMRPKVQSTARKMTWVAMEETRRGLIPYIDSESPAPAPEPEEEAADQ